jgi:hypothetical protein
MSRDRQRNAHEVALVGSLRKPRVGERVPEHVRMDWAESGLDTAALHHLRDAAVTDRPTRTQPQAITVGVPEAGVTRAATDGARFDSPVSPARAVAGSGSAGGIIGRRSVHISTRPAAPRRVSQMFARR